MSWKRLNEMFHVFEQVKINNNDPPKRILFGLEPKNDLLIWEKNILFWNERKSFFEQGTKKSIIHS